MHLTASMQHAVAVLVAVHRLLKRLHQVVEMPVQAERVLDEMNASQRLPGPLVYRGGACCIRKHLGRLLQGSVTRCQA